MHMKPVEDHLGMNKSYKNEIIYCLARNETKNRSLLKNVKSLKKQNYLLNYLLTPWSRVLLEKLTSKLCRQARNSPHLWNPRVPHCIHKCPPSFPILSQLHPVHTTLSNFLKINFNIILPSTSWSPQWPLSFRLPHQHPAQPSILPHTRHLNAHFIRLDFTTRTILGKKYRSFSSSLCSFLHSPITSSLLGTNTLNSLFSNTLSLRSSLNVSYQVSHHTKPQAKL